MTAPLSGRRGGRRCSSPKPRVRPRERVLTRTQVQVREAGQASVFAVIGFLAVGVFAALLLLSYTQYAVLTDQVVTLRSELTDPPDGERYAQRRV